MAVLFVKGSQEQLFSLYTHQSSYSMSRKKKQKKTYYSSQEHG